MADRKTKAHTPLTHRHYLSVRHIDRFMHNGIEQWFSGSRVLDYGCGNKPYSEVADQVHATLIGVDVEQSSMRKADVLSSRTGALPFGSNSFDGAICTQVLEHVADPSLLLSEIRRVLKPGACCLLTAPFVWEHHELPHDYFRFTAMGIRELVSKAGFAVVSLEGCGRLWETVGQMLVNRIPWLPYFDVLLVAPCNWLFDRLDRWFPIEGITSNWQVVLQCDKAESDAHRH